MIDNHMPKRRFPRTWFVYALVDQRNGKPFYVGITTDWDRRKDQHLNNPCLSLLDVKPSMECIRKDLDEQTARRIERHLIRKLPGLVNVTHAVKDKSVQSLNGTTVRLERIGQELQIVSQNIP
jgi:hypothetical protein